MSRIAENHNHRVKIHLKTADVWNIEDRIAEVHTIRYWVDELTEWQEDMYSVNIHNSAGIMDIWFKEENHAVLCALRWL